MDISWLEDYLALRELGSFTAAARRRNASQPAFSRRIQALEAWLGVTLVDRSRRPPSFTPLAIENDREIRSLLNNFHDLRSRMIGEQKSSSRIRLAIQHSLSITFFPTILRDMVGDTNYPVYWLHCEDRSRCIELMFRGEVEFLICYETPKLGAAVPATLATRRAVGADAMVLVGLPVSRCDRDAGDPGGRRLPLLTYPQSNFFGQILWEQMVPDLSANFDIETICVSGFSGALKQMVLCGMGFACLPKSLVQDEIDAGTLKVFYEDEFRCDMDIVIYMRTSDISDAQAHAWRSLFNA